MIYKTSLNEDPRKLQEAQNLWQRGEDWYLHKVGSRGWKLASCFGDFPTYKTKKEAAKVATDLILAASSYESNKK